MNIYNYHKEYKYYTGTTQADESPLESGVFLVPAYATTIEPPQCQQSEIQIFDNDQWSVIENNIGMFYRQEDGVNLYNPNPSISPSGYVREEPPEQVVGYKLAYENNQWSLEPDLESMRQLKLGSAEEKWLQDSKDGWQTPYGWSLGVQVDDVSLLSANFMLAKEASSMGLNDPTFIVDTAGVSHEFNLQDLTALMLQYGQARAVMSSANANLRQQIISATTVEELESITI